MVATSILSTDAEMVAMAGELVDATGFTDGNKTSWGLQAEAYIVALTEFDFVTNIATINAVTKAMLSEYVARYVAVSAIAYNLATVGATFSSLIELEDMIQLHIYRMEQILELLKKQSAVDFMKS